MTILGIETSCDETAAAVVDSGRRILSNVVASQFDVHRRYGGVVPELASREHLRAIVPVVRQALDDASLTYQDLSAIAVTCGPGLVGSLLVGICYGKALSLSLNIPLIAVNHLEGHIHAVLLEHPDLEFPALAMVVSGGHTHMFSTTQTGPSQFSYRLVGRTRDDAAGEAFDKVAKLLGLGYPGGPAIDRLAPHGNPRAVRFTTARMKGNALDFSFSGIKTAVLRHVQAAGTGMEEEITRRKHFLEQNPRPSIEAWLEVIPRSTLDLIASFQYTVVAELVRHAVAAAERENARSLIISGGVACNTQLREAFRSEAVAWPVYFPTPKLSTDNAAMIAAAAYPKLVSGNVADLALAAQASLPL